MFYGDKLVLEQQNVEPKKTEYGRKGNTYRAMDGAGWDRLWAWESSFVQDAENCVRVLDAVEQSIASNQCAPCQITPYF